MRTQQIEINICVIAQKDYEKTDDFNQGKKLNLSKEMLTACINEFGKIDGTAWNRFVCLSLNANNFNIFFHILDGLFEDWK